MNIEFDNLIMSFIAEYNLLIDELNEYVGKHPKKPRGRPIIYLTIEDRKHAYRENYRSKNKNIRYL